MKDYPVIKVTILFIIGILSAHFFDVNIIVVSALFIAGVVLLLFHKRFSDNFYYSFLVFLVSGILVFSIGNLLAKENEISFSPFLTNIDKVKNTTAIGRIDRIDLIKSNELILYLNADSVYSEEFYIKDKIQLICKIKSDNKSLFELYDKLKPGNYLKLTGYYYKGREKRNPGEFDYDAYLKSKGILGILSINDTSSIKVINQHTDFFKNLIHQTRKKIDWQIKKYQSPETASLLRGLLLADRGEINYQTKQQFTNSGVVHVLAVSGLHVGYIILIFLFLFGRFNLFLRSILTVVGLLCFMFITGIPPSVFRATVMAIVIIVAYLSNRSTNLFNSISIAALIILIINPNEIYNPGFQLSFAAVLSIALVYPFLEKHITSWNIQSKILKFFIVLAGVSLSAQIGTLPFTLMYFNKFSIIALFTNLIVIPTIGFIIATAVVTLALSSFLPVIAIYFATANDLITKWTLSLIKFSGELSFSHVNIYDYTLTDLILFYLMLAILLYYLPRFKNRIVKVALFGLVAANVILYSSIDSINLLPENYLSVFMIDVGQGDSFLIRFPNGKTALVDAGNTTIAFDNGERVIIPLLKYLGIEKINYGLVSHIDADHYGGFVALVLDGLIGEIYKPTLDTSLSKDKRFEEFLVERKIPVKYYSESKMEIGNAALYFLYDSKIDNIAGESTNNHSGIFKLVYGETSFLFTGDVEKNIEKIYAEKYKKFLDSDVLKAGHHGSKTSSSDVFLNYVTPKYSLISAGFKNKFGHPASEVMQRLEKYGSTIYRTDLQKAVLLRSDGKRINVINW
ncbi:MAG: DNA internalization-related competence protein ComEC/Rec2 [Ignavibacteriaceae bacterium]|nr:DNA internalization-related competence protein ComEC/Rec2 [Ignavibacteriaceae bacterium]MCW8812095.1 DNA internalization-related competence protein ComEC/Rec2 [Chlorobium sp.]MCW8818277.1 DNA internalization-related competence protein ComEC/Rec2 [Ignavibacteriaceae bacterium]MCW9095132.1 DNA internalization-related competence protein ComEC/Rec2 [Ignavibacteriaceae bacterium]